MTKLDGPERTATIKPVFCQNEMVVNFDFCTIAAGVTSVPFTSGWVAVLFSPFLCRLWCGKWMVSSVFKDSCCTTLFAVVLNLFSARDAQRLPRSCHENILRHPVNEGVTRCI